MADRTLYDPRKVNCAVAACLVVIFLALGGARWRDTARVAGESGSAVTVRS